MSDSVALMIVAHAPLANALKDVARHVFGQDVPLTAVDVLPGACAADSSAALLERIRSVNEGGGVLVMTDLPGASPSNVCARAAAMARDQGLACHVIGGVNAAMVLRAVSYRESALQSLIEQVLEGAAQAVMRVD